MSICCVGDVVLVVVGFDGEKTSTLGVECGASIPGARRYLTLGDLTTGHSLLGKGAAAYCVDRFNAFEPCKIFE